jgi:hypothetical protein
MALACSTNGRPEERFRHPVSRGTSALATDQRLRGQSGRRLGSPRFPSPGPSRPALHFGRVRRCSGGRISVLGPRG